MRAGNRWGPRSTGLFPEQYIQVFIKDPDSINTQRDRAQPEPQRPARVQMRVAGRAVGEPSPEDQGQPRQEQRKRGCLGRGSAWQPGPELYGALLHSIQSGKVQTDHGVMGSHSAWHSGTRTRGGSSDASATSPRRHALCCPLVSVTLGVSFRSDLSARGGEKSILGCPVTKWL